MDHLMCSKAPASANEKYEVVLCGFPKTSVFLAFLDQENFKNNN